jgi:hypothetical protein
MIKTNDFAKDILAYFCELASIKLSRIEKTDAVNYIAYDQEDGYMDLAFQGLPIGDEWLYVVPDAMINVIPHDRKNIEGSLGKEYNVENTHSFDGFGEYKLFYLLW